jgi:hypothetical protein
MSSSISSGQIQADQHAGQDLQQWESGDHADSPQLRESAGEAGAVHLHGQYTGEIPLFFLGNFFPLPNDIDPVASPLQYGTISSSNQS